MGYIRLKYDYKQSNLQGHVHEVQGYVKMGAQNHYHQYALITGNAIPVNGKEHVHEVYFRTNLVNGHYHEYTGTTLGTVEIGDRHIHYIEASSVKNTDHSHDFLLVTSINNPTKN